MGNPNGVSVSVIRRLPRYYRFLGDLLRNGVERISSKELANILGLTASQIRQDLNCFGGFGQQGYGYNVSVLRLEIGTILGLHNRTKTILIGAGNLGRAIINHMGFESAGFSLIAVFDNDPQIIGQSIKNIVVKNIHYLDDFCKKHNPQVAVLSIPKEAAEQLTKHLVELGVNGFWNFSHYDLSETSENVIVENVHLGDSLMTLGYRLNNIAVPSDSDNQLPT